ncbi:hypothetical protein KIL84_003079 [Mauremys mutica]|uniref:Uncharacterized protein n=1 Tax=Mauremys mutica TaxID=74926 RepID=A0A9D4AT43_9SAUR|nr:hypothetical protein KIL84_003079 [Mauremys mutica]
MATTRLGAMATPVQGIPLSPTLGECRSPHARLCASCCHGNRSHPPLAHKAQRSGQLGTIEATALWLTGLPDWLSEDGAGPVVVELPGTEKRSAYGREAAGLGSPRYVGLRAAGDGFVPASLHGVLGGAFPAEINGSRARTVQPKGGIRCLPCFWSLLVPSPLKSRESRPAHCNPRGRTYSGGRPRPLQLKGEGCGPRIVGIQ